MPGLYQPDEREAIGLHEAHSLIKDLGLSRVIVEMDAKLVVEAINGVVHMNSVFSDIVDGCRSILVTNSGFGFVGFLMMSMLWLTALREMLEVILVLIIGLSIRRLWIALPILLVCVSFGTLIFFF
ncbi:hypothetical protein ACS0TY_025567 [Phlomoides rotata]